MESPGARARAKLSSTTLPVILAVKTWPIARKLTASTIPVTAVSANARQSQLLSVKAGAPLLLMRELHYGAANRRLLYSVNFHNSAVVDLALVRAGVRT